VEFRILGPLEVRAKGGVVPLAGKKQRALLTLLLLHANQVVSSNELIDELWDADSPDAGRAALRVRIHELRKVLPDDVLQTRSPGYMVRVDPEGLDLHQFERLLEDGRRSLEAGAAGDAAVALGDALALWRGPPLADVASERFAGAAAARLEELRLVALELRLEAEMARGRNAEAVAELESLVGEHPLREQLCRLLMLALYRSGRQAEALDAYRRARDVLSGELGLEPSAALRALERAILRQDPSLDTSPAQGIRPVAPRSVLVAHDDERPGADRLIAVAESIVRPGTHELILARLVDGDANLAAAAAAVRARCEELERRGSIARSAVFTSERPGADLVRLVAEQDADLLLVTAPRGLLQTGAVDGDVAALLHSAPCDVALLAGGELDDGGPVVVPFGGAEHDWAAVELGAWAARARGVPLRLLGADAVPEAGKRDASRLLSHASLAVQRALGVAAEPMLVTPGVDAILVASEHSGLLVLGLSARWSTQGLGDSRRALARDAPSPVLLVRKGLRPGGLVPRSALTRFTWSVRA
jgi:DNA-binding SARP family transcriptional activator